MSKRSRSAMPRTRTLTAIGASGLLIVTSVAACSSSSKSSATSSNAATGSSSGNVATGSPLTVAINTPIDSAYGDFPGSVAAVKAVARAINNSGGINGHVVKVISCQTQGDPNLEVGCARKAVSAGAITTINSFIFSNATGYLSELASANIADIGSEVVAPQFAQAANVFPLTFGFAGFASCTSPQMAKQAGGNRFSTYIAELPSSKPLEDNMITGTKNQGNVWAGAANTPASVTDWSPIVQEVANLKPNVVIPGGGAQQYGPFLTSAVGTGHKWSYCTFASGNLSKKLAPVGAAADAFYDGNALPTLASEDQIPALKTFASQMQAEVDAGDSAAKVSGVNFDWEMLQAWLGMQVFEQVAKSISGPVTSATFLAALKTAKFSGLGIISPIDFSKPQTYGAFTRVFNPYSQLERWNSATKQFVVVPGTKINGAQILFGAATK